MRGFWKLIETCIVLALVIWSICEPDKAAEVFSEVATKMGLTAKAVSRLMAGDTKGAGEAAGMVIHGYWIIQSKPSPTPLGSAPPRPAADQSCLTIQNVDSSRLSTNKVYMELSWQVNVANSCAAPFNVRVVFKIFDTDDFELDSDEEDISVPANDIGKARKILLVGPLDKAARFAKQSATLEIL